MPRQAFVGAGSNLGDRRATLGNAIARLERWPGIIHVDVSTICETDPVGVVDQPRFLNLVAGVETTLAPEDLLGALFAIEHEFGRVRHERWGPRTLDLDLLLYEGETRDTPALMLPHPRLFEREFVTVPLREMLARPRFAIAAWDELRRRLGRAPRGRAGPAD